MVIELSNPTRSALIIFAADSSDARLACWLLLCHRDIVSGIDMTHGRVACLLWVLPGFSGRDPAFSVWGFGGAPDGQLPPWCTCRRAADGPIACPEGCCWLALRADMRHRPGSELCTFYF
jgi:hypothetical protein